MNNARVAQRKTLLIEILPEA